MNNQSRGRRLISLVFSLIFILAAGWIFLNRQMLQDKVTLASYRPSEEIVALAEAASLSGRGEDLFFVNRPELHGKTSFTDVCSGLGDEQSNVLGCFNGTRIYIFNVSDAELRGVREVTAAHEMLHAAYMRLSQGEREHVDSLIKKQLKTEMQPHITELIEIYNRLEPGQLLNEMHSILATEQKNLIPELEAYYKTYFENRRAVVKLSDAYRGVFDSLKNRQQVLATELDRLATQINQSTEALNRRVTAYNAEVEQFNIRARSGTMSEAEFNQERTALEAERQEVNAAISSNDTLRDIYEKKRREYESLAVEFTKLQNNIDSRPSTPDSVQ